MTTAMITMIATLNAVCPLVAGAWNAASVQQHKPKLASADWEELRKDRTCKTLLRKIGSVKLKDRIGGSFFHSKTACPHRDYLLQPMAAVQADFSQTGGVGGVPGPAANYQTAGYFYGHYNIPFDGQALAMMLDPIEHRNLVVAALWVDFEENTKDLIQMHRSQTKLALTAANHAIGAALGNVANLLAAGLNHAAIVDLANMFQMNQEGFDAREISGNQIYRAMQGQSDEAKLRMMNHSVLTLPNVFKPGSATREQVNKLRASMRIYG